MIAVLLALALFAVPASAQVGIDDARVVLDSGDTLQQAIADGDLGAAPLCTAAQLAAETCGTATAGRLAVVTDAHRNTSCEIAASGGALPVSMICKYAGTAPSGSWLPYPTPGTIVIAPGQYPNSTSAGLQEAIDSSACASGCTIRLTTGTYTFTCNPATMATNQGCLDINERSNIFIVGDGYDRTTLSWSYDSNTFATPFKISMIRVRGRDDDQVGGPVPSENILFHNMSIGMHDTCNPTTGTCDDQALTATVKIQEATDVQIITSEITCDELHGNYSELFGQICRAVWINGDEYRGTTDGGDYPSQRVWITNSLIGGSGRGLEFHLCRDCWVEGSTLFSPTERNPAYRPTRAGVIVKYMLDGVRIVNNTLSLGWVDSDFPGVDLRLMSGGQRDGEAGAYVQLIGNTFLNKGFPSKDDVCTAANEPFDSCTGAGVGNTNTAAQIWMTGYNFADISGNTFLCDNETYCQGRGIWFVQDAGCEYPNASVGNCNSGNVIANNVWHRWRAFDWEGEASAGFRCPVVLDNPVTLSPIDAAGNNGLRNLFTGNIFDLRDGSGVATNGPGFTGFCWSNESFAMQTVVGNITRVGAQGPYGPAVPIEVLADVPCQSGNAGVTYEISDGVSATDCTAAGGTTRVVCRCNGTAWTAL